MQKLDQFIRKKEKEMPDLEKPQTNAVLSLPSVIRKGIFQLRDFPIHVG